MELQRTNGLKILGGCAGFAAVLPPFLGWRVGQSACSCINAPLLVLCGSLNPITKRQLEYGAAHGGVRISLQSEQLAAGYFESRAGQDFLTQIEQRMQGGCDMLIDTDGTETAEDADTAEQLRGQIAEQLGLLMALLLERPAADNYLPMIIGGDTLMGFMQQLPEAEISPWERLHRARCSSWRRWPVMFLHYRLQVRRIWNRGPAQQDTSEFTERNGR